MVQTFAENMKSSDYQSAQTCYIFLEELLNHMDLRDPNDNLRCAVCGSLFYFHKRRPRSLVPSSNPPASATSCSTSSTFSNIDDSPNLKLGLACDTAYLSQSTFIAPMQSIQNVSPMLLSASLGSCSSGVNEGNKFPFPHVYNSALGIKGTQDLSEDFEVEAVKANLVSDVHRCSDICDDDYIFSQDLFNNDYDQISSNVDVEDRRRLSSTSSDRCQSEISSVTGFSSVVSGECSSAITGISGKSIRGRRKKDQIHALYGKDWHPIGVDLKGFNVDQLAPGTIYDSNQLYFTDPHLNPHILSSQHS